MENAPVELWMVTSSTQQQAISALIQKLNLLARQMPLLINMVPPTMPAPPNGVNTILLLCMGENDILNDDFKHWVDWAIGEIKSNPVFRVYVFPYDFKPDVFQSELKQNPFQSLRDHVQINLIDDPDSVIIQISNYAKEKTNIIHAIQAKNIYNKIKEGLRIYSQATELIGGVLIIYTILAALLKLGISPILASLGIGMMGIFCSLNILAFRVNPKLSITHWKVFLFLNIVGIIITALLPLFLTLDPQWLIMGVCLAFLSEIARRGNPEILDLKPEPDKFTEEQNCEYVIYGHKTPIHPINLPLLPEEIPQVFISYSKSDGSQFANELYDKLKQHKIDCFMDHATIPGGARWCYILSEWLNDVNIFILVYSTEAAKRPWVAAELDIALRRQKRTGLPHIIVLLQDDSQQDSNIEKDSFPVFKYLLNFRKFNFTNNPRKIKFIHVNDQTIETISQSLRPDLSRFHTDSVFSHTLFAFSRLFWGVFQFIGAFSKIIGNLGLLLTCLLFTNLFTSSQPFMENYWGGYIISYLIGFIVPLWLAEKIEVRPQARQSSFLSPGPDVLNLTGFLGLALWLMAFLKANTTPFFLAACWVLFLTGLLLAIDYKRNAFRWAPIEKTSVSA